MDVARILFTLQNNGVESPDNIRVTLTYSPSSSPGKVEKPEYLDIPRPKDGRACRPKEVWDIFNNLKVTHGPKMHKHIKAPLINALINDKSDNQLVLVCYRNVTRLLSKLEADIDNDWNIRGRKRLAALNDVTNVVFKKAKSNPGCGVAETEVTKIITEKMNNNVDVNNYVPSDRTLTRHMNEVKVASVLDGGFSVTKASAKKDMHRHTSENSLRNVLSYLM